MSYSISSVINNTTQQILAGKTNGSPYKLVTQSDSIFNLTPAGATGPASPFPLGIVDTSVNPRLWASSERGIIESSNIPFGWKFYTLRNKQWIQVYTFSSLPIDQNIPIAISTNNPLTSNPAAWWKVDGTRVNLLPLQDFPPTTDESYQFYISTYNNLVTGSYNVLASSGTSTLTSTNKIIKSADPTISRESILVDFTNFPDVVVTTSRLCSPISVQSYKGYKISPTEFFLAENQTTIDIALESGNLKPNFIVKKSFNKNHAHIVQFKDSYLFISKETGISATTLDNINKINQNNGYPKMYPLRNAINCPNSNING